MSIHLQRQIETLKQHTLALGAACQRQIDDALRSVPTRDAVLAQQVIDREVEFDRQEVDIEEESFHLLALHQPVAKDIREVLAVMRIANDLERVSDHAANIAKHVLCLRELPDFGAIPFEYEQMEQTARRMLRMAIESFESMDTQEAQYVRTLDDRVDEIHRAMYAQIVDAMSQNPGMKHQYMHLAGISRKLERIADHACNIVKQVISAVDGDNCRHRANPLDRLHLTMQPGWDRAAVKSA